MKTIIRRFLPLLLAFTLLAGCSLFESFEEETIPIDALRLNRTSLTAAAGVMEHLSVAVTPSDRQKDITLEWSYDENIISVSDKNNYGITFTGLKAGQTNLSCSYGGVSASCIVSITETPAAAPETTPPVTERTGTDPYIYSNTTILQMAPGGREKIFVSLYGGNAGDIDGYTWTIEDNTVATIQPTGQYCVIEAKSKGYSRIKVTHNKAVYPYYIGIYVFQESVNTYITTGDNIITMNQNDPEKRVNVSLVNGLSSSNDSSFRWEILTDDGVNAPVRIDSTANSAVLHPVRGGTCTVRVSHPDAPYPLDILCRVIVVVRNVYIESDVTILDINDSDEHTVSASLRNVDGTYPDSDFSYSIDDTAVAEIVSEIGGKVIVRAKANGFCKLVISHPMAEYDKEVLISVKGQATDANSSYRAINLSTNYIRTKVGASVTSVEANLVGGGGDDYFVWTAIQRNTNGSIGNVITIEKSRNIAYIEPCAEGTAVITVSHPESAASQEILVKVLPANAVLEEPFYFSGSGLIKMLNGSTYEYKVVLSGNGKTAADDQNIRWSVGDGRYYLSPAGASCHITAPSLGAGVLRTVLTISHDRAENDKTITLISADDEETLDSIKLLVTNKSYYNLNIGDEDVLGLIAEGFDYDEFNYSHLRWSVSNPNLVQISPIDSTALCRINALKAGSATVTAQYDDLSCLFTVYVYPEGVMAFEPEPFLTTSNNYLSIYNINDTVTAYLHATNLSVAKCEEITWFTEDSNIVSLMPNGTECTIRSLSPGNATVYASHPDCVNIIKFYITAGGQNISQTDLKNTESLSCQQNYVQTKPGNDSIITVNLHNLGSGAENRLVWTITEQPDTSGQKVINAITPTGTINGDFQADSTPVTDKKTVQYGKIAVQAQNPGTAYITVRHPQAKNSISIVVRVLPAGAVLEDSLYFSGTNIITFTNDKSYFYSVSLNGINKADGDESSISWLCDNDDFSVMANGQDAMIISGASGYNVAHITISHPKVLYPKNVLVITADTASQLAEAKAVYMPSTAYNVNVSGSIDIPLRFYGYTSIDNDRVVWSSSSPDVAYVSNGTVTGIREGTAEITARYMTSSVSCKVFVYPAGVNAGNDPEQSQGGSGTTDDSGIKLTVLSDDIRIDSSRNGRSITFTVKNDIYDTYSWLLDDEEMYITSPSVTINTDEYAEGSYDLTLFATKGGMCYSAYVQIQIH